MVYIKNTKRLFLILTLIAALAANHVIAYAKPSRRTPPTAPTSLSFTGLTASEVTLSWPAVSGATGYRLYRATPNDSGYTLIATISSTSYKNTSLTAGTKYWYFVRAYNSYGSSPDSQHISLMTPALPVSTTPSKLVMGFATYYYSGDSSSYNSIVSNTQTISEIATHTYITDGLGNISGLVPTSQITYANNNGIKAYAMVSNNFDGAIAQTLLENSANRSALINNLLAAVKANGYKGVNVDLEGVYYYDRSYLTTFMNELYTAFKPIGLTVTLAVPAKTADSPTASWSGAYDYAALAAYSDQIVLMTYDEHYPGGTPGPIASIGWVENVIKYAVSVIPKDKLLLGTPAYGYDWSSNGTKAYGIADINMLASTYQAAVLWDTVSQSPYFTYTDSSNINHTVWFENGKSLNYKLDLVNSYNLSGIAIWRLGLEDADYFTSIRTKFNLQ